MEHGELKGTHVVNDFRILILVQVKILFLKLMDRIKIKNSLYTKVSGKTDFLSVKSPNPPVGTERSQNVIRGRPTEKGSKRKFKV